MIAFFQKRAYFHRYLHHFYWLLWDYFFAEFIFCRSIICSYPCSSFIAFLTTFRAVGHGELCTNFWLAIRLLFLLLPDWIVNTVLWSYHDPYSSPLNRYELALHVPNVAKTMKVADFKVIGRSLHRYIWSFYLIVGA